MGTGALLDIKCGYLHNTLVTWFTRLYHSGRKGFVVPRRGFIPLTEESVHQILGIPRGDIDIKYEADYDNEDEIGSSLFPGDGSRPKITTVATAINNNNDLRYLDALDCDGMELELPDIPYTVNACSKTHVDVVAEMDMLEHDPPSFGNFQDKLKATTVITKFASGVGTLFNQFASGVDTLLTELVQGLTAPATRNTTTSRIKRGTEARESDDTSSEDSAESDNDTNEHNVDIERDKKKRMTREEDITRGNVESPLMKNVRDVAGEMENTTYNPSHGANFFGGARETKVCDNTSSGDPSAQFDTKSPSRSTSHLNLPSDRDMCSPDNNSPTDILVSLISKGNSQELEEKIRGSAAGLANRPCELKSTRPADIERGDGSTHEEIKCIIVKELGLLKETCGQQFEERNTRKDLRKINARPIKMTPRRKFPESMKEDGEKKLKNAQQPGVNVSIKRKDPNAPIPKMEAKNTPITISPKMSPRMQPSTGIGEIVETGLQMVEYPLSDKLTAFLATGDQDEIDADLAEELDDYERYLGDFFKKKCATATAAGAARSNNMEGETGVQSVTPKTNPHKGRVKKSSRFKLSPYDDDINVISEEEDIYKKLMLSSKYKRNGNSSIKK
ncbi:hypothetical protein ZWY2020_033873 [Hordeum vulgare]|nr:hypothetical protein ZWY2020_033873 [Hordeum vulgare]